MSIVSSSSSVPGMSEVAVWLVGPDVPASASCSEPDFFFFFFLCLDLVFLNADISSAERGLSTILSSLTISP